MEEVKFKQDHHFAKKGEVIKMDAQTTDTFVKMGIVERVGTPKKEKANFTPNVENAKLD